MSQQPGNEPEAPPLSDRATGADPSHRCKVCRALLDEEDLFCGNCGLEAPPRDPNTELPASRTATYNFECSGCGASMSYDASARALRCPFCGSTQLEKQDDQRIIAPNRVVPFRLTSDEAVASLRAWLGRGFWRPGDLARQAKVAELAKVYVPYWVFRASTHSFWTADTSQTPSGARGDWHPRSGQHQDSYGGLLVGASGALAPRETGAIAPFDLTEGVPPERADLENVTVEQFGVPRKYARPLARRGLEDLVRAAVDAEYVPGRSRNVHVNVKLEGLTSEPVLLPVYIMAYRYRDRLFRFLVNGQTGQATGSAPFSWAKVGTIAAIAAGAVALLLAVAACAGLFHWW